MKRQPSSKIKKRPGEIVLFAIVFLIFVIYAVMLFYPLIWGLLSSFKSVKDYNNSPFSFPSVWHFENYIEAVKAVLIFFSCNYFNAVRQIICFTVNRIKVAYSYGAA